MSVASTRSIALAPLAGLVLAAACSGGGKGGKAAADAAVDGRGGDGRPGDAGRDLTPDTVRAIACNGACVGVCRGLCVGVCPERNEDGDCLAPCEGTCIGMCEGTCARGGVRFDGGPPRPEAGVDTRGAERPPAAPDAGDPAVYGTWTDRTRVTSASWPPLGHTGAMVFDSRRIRVVMFGGFRERSNGTWEWNPETNSWTLMQQLGGARPSRRTGHALVFDRVRGKVILHGGIDDSGASSNETWEWDGDREAWTQRGPGPVPSRWGHAMVFDESTGRAVLFGGAHRHPMLGDGELLDTWEYHPAEDRWVNWTYPLPGIWPRARRGHAMAYDPTRKVSVIYGGELANVGVAGGDLWEWSGTLHAWRERPPPPAGAVWPGPRAFASLTYVGDGQMLLLGREGPGFYRWTGGTNQWQDLTPPRGSVPFPGPRDNAAAAWDSVHSILVVAGGAIALGREVLTDTWLWRP